jgi:hypothetical protein
MFNNCFSENRTFYEIMSENMAEAEGSQLTSQYGAYAFHAGLPWLHARTRMHTPMRPVTHMHARTYRPISNNYGFSTATTIRESVSKLRYTYIASLVIFIAHFLSFERKRELSHSLVRMMVWELYL